jgi:hypothetical protein
MDLHSKGIQYGFVWDTYMRHSRHVWDKFQCCIFPEKKGEETKRSQTLEDKSTSTTNG